MMTLFFKAVGFLLCIHGLMLLGDFEMRISLSAPERDDIFLPLSALEYGALGGLFGLAAPWLGRFIAWGVKD